MMQQHKKCPSKIELLQYALIEKEMPESIRDHLTTCTDCLEEIQSVKAMNHQLLTAARPVPPTASKREYHKALNQSMKQIQQKKIQTHIFFRPAFISSFSALCIFVMGLWMGKLFWTPSNDSMKQLELTQMQTQRLNQYLQQSEVWLLTFMNQSENSDSQWKIDDKILTQQLLEQTYQLERESEFFDNPMLLPFIEQIEAMLLEIANVDSNQIENTFTLIRSSVENRQLLLQSQSIQKELAETNNLNLSRL